MLNFLLSLKKHQPNQGSHPKTEGDASLKPNHASHLKMEGDWHRGQTRLDRPSLDTEIGRLQVPPYLYQPLTVRFGQKRPIISPIKLQYADTGGSETEPNAGKESREICLQIPPYQSQPISILGKKRPTISPFKSQCANTFRHEIRFEESVDEDDESVELMPLGSDELLRMQRQLIRESAEKMRMKWKRQKNRAQTSPRVENDTSLNELLSAINCGGYGLEEPASVQSQIPGENEKSLNTMLAEMNNGEFGSNERPESLTPQRLFTNPLMPRGGSLPVPNETALAHTDSVRQNEPWVDVSRDDCTTVSSLSGTTVSNGSGDAYSVSTAIGFGRSNLEGNYKISSLTSFGVGPSSDKGTGKNARIPNSSYGLSDCGKDTGRTIVSTGSSGLVSTEPLISEVNEEDPDTRQELHNSTTVSTMAERSETAEESGGENPIVVNKNMQRGEMGTKPVAENGQQAFASIQEFKEYFDKNPEMMREFLVIWTTNPERLLHSPGLLYHRKGTVMAADIPALFYEAFEYHHFLRQDNGVVVDPKVAVRIDEVISPIYKMKQDAAAAAIEVRDQYKYKMDQARKAHRKLLVDLSEDQRDKALKYIYKLRKRYQDVTADGGETNGEFTKGSIEKICDIMKSCGVSKDDCIVDLGSAFGFLNWIFCLYFECTSYGIEIVHDRYQMATRLYPEIVDEMAAAGINVEGIKIGQLHADLMQLQELPRGTTVVYGFDHVFTIKQLMTLIPKYAASPTVRVMILGKPETSIELRKKLQQLEFERLEKASSRMTISQEGKTMGVWLRNTTTRPISPFKNTQCQSLEARDVMKARFLHSDPQWMNETLQLMIHGDPNTRRSAFHEQHRAVVALQAEMRRRRKFENGRSIEKTPCERLRYYQCEATRDCEDCRQYFSHRSTDLVPGENGRGLYASKSLSSNEFLFEIPGTFLSRHQHPPRGQPLIHLPYNKVNFLPDKKESEASALLRKVRTVSNNPNCVIQPWQNGEGKWCLSLVTRRSVRKGDELQYDDTYEMPNEYNADDEVAEVKRVLLACMKYGNLGGEDVSELVASKKWKDMDGRDTNRILAMERNQSYCVYTTNNGQSGASPRLDRHIYADLRRANWVDLITEFIKASNTNGRALTATAFFSCVIFDEFWNPRGYNCERWGTALYNKHLANLAPLLQPGGFVMFPFHRDVLTNLASSESGWIKVYSMEFIPEHNRVSNPLWLATQTLQAHELFGKKNDDCVYTSIAQSDVREIRDTAPGSVVYRSLQEASRSGTLGQMRYIRLKKNQ